MRKPYDVAQINTFVEQIMQFATLVEWRSTHTNLQTNLLEIK